MAVLRMARSRQRVLLLWHYMADYLIRTRVLLQFKTLFSFRV